MKKSANLENSSNNPTCKQENKWLEIEQRVRYSETDQMGIAHNKSYFEWFEIGRTEYCRQKNIPYKNIETRGYYLVVVEAFCRYKKALKYDEKFIIRIFPEEITAKKVRFSYQLAKKEKKSLIATGYTTHIVTNSKAQPCSLPTDIFNKIKA
ncbi:acyl-CoA thioesterase [Acidobacteriota bacterium]